MYGVPLVGVIAFLFKIFLKLYDEWGIVGNTYFEGNNQCQFDQNDVSIYL